MLIKYSGNIFRQFFGIAFHNKFNIVLFALLGTTAYTAHHYLGYKDVVLPLVPVSILGGALAIFLGFRNSSAYDRWWEARKIWGGIVNSSRTFTMMVMSFASPFHSKNEVSEEVILKWKREMIYRQIAWTRALQKKMLKQDELEGLDDLLSSEELAKLKGMANIPTQLLFKQGNSLRAAYEKAFIEDFRHMELANVVKELYNLQGKSERIKNTVFPYYYNYFTRVFLWMFACTLPFGLVGTMEIGAIPMNIAISFVFFILEKAGSVTEDPFENRAADVPITTITRAIEIDLREMLGESDIPKPIATATGKFGIRYQT